MNQLECHQPHHSLLEAHQTPSIEDNKKLVARAKNGEMWECVDWTHDISGGKIYTFRMKPEYDFKKNQALYKDYLSKEREIYPAIESTASISLALMQDPNSRNSYWDTEADKLSLNTTLDDSIKKGLLEACDHMRSNNYILCQARESLKKLGYGCQSTDNDIQLVLPDRTALMARWAILQKEHPELPPLDIIDSEGIAGDMEFVEAFINYDCTLSSGKEFVHDHTSHLIPILAFMLLKITDKTECTYSEVKSNLAKSVMQNYHKVTVAKKWLSNGIPWIDEKVQELAKEKFPQIETVLGVFVDTISNEINPKNVMLRATPYLAVIKVTAETINEIASDCTSSTNLTGWNSYMKRRYGDENVLTEKQMQELWQLIDKIAVYDASIQASK